MDANKQIFAFADDIDRLVDRYRDEFDMTYAGLVGVLFMKAHLMCKEADEDRSDDDEEK